MNLLDAIKRRLGTNAPQRLSAATFVITGPLPSIHYVYAVEREAKALKLMGVLRAHEAQWIQLQVEGEHAAILKLSEKLNHAEIIPGPPAH